MVTTCWNYLSHALQVEPMMYGDTDAARLHHQAFKTYSVQDGIPSVPNTAAIFCVQDAKESATQMAPVI